MWNDKKVSVVFPAYNEEKNIKIAIEDFFASGFVDEIIVVDNNSKDKTAEIARTTKAKLVKESIQGYGSALQTGMKAASGDLIVMAEPDGTFMGKDIIKLLAYSDDFDVVFGTRTTRELIWKQANMQWLLRMGNVLVAKMIEFLYSGPALTDVGCTMKLIRKEAREKVKDKLSINGSHFSPAFMIACLTSDLDCIEVSVNYCPRIGESKITGRGLWPAAKLGLVMAGLILKYRVFLPKSSLPRGKEKSSMR